MCAHMRVYVRMPQGFHGLYFSKIASLIHKKSYIFQKYFPQVNLESDWTLNQPQALKFQHHWETRARVISGTKCSVYTCCVHEKYIYEQCEQHCDYHNKQEFLWAMKHPCQLARAIEGKQAQQWCSQGHDTQPQYQNKKQHLASYYTKDKRSTQQEAKLVMKQWSIESPAQSASK